MNKVTHMFRVLSARRSSLSLTVLLAIGAVAQADTLRDPTRPATAREVVKNVGSGLQLEAIMGSSTHRLAIVNGKVVRAGDRIGTALIEEIGADFIRYTRNGRSATAKIVKNSLRVRQSANLQANEAR